jgi:cation diffusion facilitator CzcD-associated flavoprotein CzcO
VTPTLPSLTRPNVDVITDSIAEVREHAVVTADGTEHEVDTIILGTGFDVPHRASERFFGRDGRSIGDIYKQRPRSYNGTCVAGFPNLFMFFGPFAAAGNQSALYMLESQMAYIVDALRVFRDRGVRTVLTLAPTFSTAPRHRTVDPGGSLGSCPVFARAA